MSRRRGCVFRNPAALLRLAGSVLVEAHNEWQVADKRDVSEATLALLNTGDDHSRTLPRQRLSQHSENLQSLRRGPDKRTTMGGP